jgi:hypothetical protein
MASEHGSLGIKVKALAGTVFLSERHVPLSMTGAEALMLAEQLFKPGLWRSGNRR